MSCYTELRALWKNPYLFRKNEEYIAKGQNVLYLLPEVSIEANHTEIRKNMIKFRDFITKNLLILVRSLEKVKSNEIKILIGTRNALFLPYQNLGLIVIDEERV